ncbi:hypothetical protein CLV30_104195 [Haloactinopolyspora alba]|uniref:Uncharacterized protein n=1 Tax=Haloactinopolyspora alba TaxID=648780 RepID=A0A2P8E790_9ACTN|nr:hypothetical protein [Haloactinopolyspora alba]PSL05329.1 hypothetical protein CLV30_104195 [Haloactinopolyspora alba]
MPEGAIVEPAGSGTDDPPCPGGDYLVTDVARLRQRAVFLRELAQARALLARTHPSHVPSPAVRERLRLDADQR